MNGDAALNLLMGRLGNRTEASLRASCLAEMTNIQQTVLEHGPTLPWFLLTEDATTDCTADERRVALPSDFLREHDEGQLFIQDSEGNWNEIEKDDFDALMGEFGYSDTADPPTKYAIVGKYIQLFPIPTEVRTLRLSKYYAKDTAPSDSAVENQWLKYAADLLIAETGIIMAGQYVQNPELIPIFSSQAQQARQRLLVDEIAREEANTTRSMGDD